MTLPHWVEQDIHNLPMNFTGQIVIECYRGGVTRRDFLDRRIASETVPSAKHVLSA